ncbi:DUF1748-domain-containing protein [Exidia glandulosa HHB12029]|uniref:DUF1748-domain-containing protein n=1 Tax=Exidia glandulosa HHB12029 TaxID=1314781 RepID=A0A165BCV9_EXIGL|nr:DUF1748-domain-containing protein [Exidia glandulosa HHB12029]
MITKLVHVAFDAALVSTAIAGLRRSSGFRPATENISDPTFRSAAERFLGVGETVFDFAQATAVNSSYFTRNPKSSS